METTLAEANANKDIVNRKLEKMRKSVLEYVGETHHEQTFMEHEVATIDQWKNASETLDDEINENEVEYLTEFKSARHAFMNLVDDLQEAAQNFLDKQNSFYN